MAKLATLTARTAATVLDTDVMYLTDAAGSNDFKIPRAAFLQASVEARTATSDGLTTGLITAGTRHVQVTSASATNICVLPAGQQGDVITMYIGANGFAIETLAAGSDKINDVDCSGAADARIPASRTVRVSKMETNNWILETFDDVGAVATLIIPS